MSLTSHPFVRVAVKGYLGWNFDLGQIRRLVWNTSVGVEGEMRGLLGGGGTGRAYPFGGGVYQASAVGELPAKQTGQLAESVLARQSKNGLAAWIGPSTKKGLESPFYPAFLVYGAERGDKGGTLGKRKNASTIAMRRYRARFNRELAKAMETAIKPGAST